MSQLSLLQEDIENIANATLPWGKLENSTVLVTGATGLLGSLLVKSLLYRNELYGANIRILAHARSHDKAEKIFAGLTGKSALALVIGDIVTPFHINETVDYIVHAASETASKIFVQKPVETIRTTIRGTENALELAKEKKIKGMVYLSSLEVYGTPALPDVAETDYGFIDPLSIRSSYSEGKRMAENLCAAYAHEYCVPVKIARLAQTFGPGINYYDNRVFAEFARCICEDENIVLRSKGDTRRNYCYTTDAICGILMVLLRGDNAQAYNIADEGAYLSIRDMAEFMLACYPKSKSKLVFDIAQNIGELGYAPTVKIKLLTSKISALDWRPQVSFKNAVCRMIDFLNDTMGADFCENRNN